MDLAIEVKGVNETLAAFLKVQQGLVDLRQLGTWDWVQSEFYKIVKEQFASEGGAGKSGKWKALSPKYKRWKDKHYEGKLILQRKGELYKSMTSEGATGSHVVKEAQQMEIGSTLDTARYHSSPEDRTKIPLRKIIDFSPEQEKRLAKPIEEKLKQLIANARLSDERGF